MDNTIQKMRIFIEGMQIQAAVKEKQQPFTALVTYAGKLSDHFVGGTENVSGGPFKVLIPADLMRRKIGELPGKHVFACTDLNSHQSTKYVGKFVDAWTEGADEQLAAKASGILYRDVDSDLVARIVDLSRQDLMGFSYDLKDVHFKVKESSDGSESQYIELTDFAWRGATILKRDTAAYEDTRLAAAAKSKSTINFTSLESEESDMTKEEIQALISDGLKPAFTEFQNTVVKPLTASITEIQTSVEELKGKQTTLEAAINDGKEKSKNTEGDKGKKEGDAATPPADGGQKVLAGDFMATIANTIVQANAESMKAIVEPLTKTVEALANKLKESGDADDKGGTRQTLSAEGVSVLKKYGDLSEDAEPTIDNYSTAIDMVQNDVRLSKEQKGSLLRDLGAAKRALMRSTAQRRVN